MILSDLKDSKLFWLNLALIFVRALNKSIILIVLSVTKWQHSLLGGF